MGKVTLKQVYELAQKNKGEDRLTQSDIKEAKRSLGYKDPSPEIKADAAKKGKMMKKASMGALIGFGADKLLKKSEGARKFANMFGLTGMAASKYYSDKAKSDQEAEQQVAKKTKGGFMIGKGKDYIKDLL